MPPRIENPITVKIRKFLALGVETKEDVSDKCRLKYPTFINIFSASRPTISKVTIMGLIHGGYITKKDVELYNKWKVKNSDSIKRLKDGIKESSADKASPRKYKIKSPGHKFSNPIARKLQSIIDSGLMTRERMSRSLEINYNTFMNIFDDKPISYSILKKLEYGKVVNKIELNEYGKWCVSYMGKNKKRKSNDKRNTAKSKGVTDKHQEQDGSVDETSQGKV